MAPSPLSTLFESWIHPTTPNSPTRASAIFVPEKKSVSGPMLVEHGAGNSHVPAIVDNDKEDDLDASFEQMVVGLYRMRTLLAIHKVIARYGSQRSSARGYV